MGGSSHRPSVLVPVVVMAVLAAGCGGGGDQGRADQAAAGDSGTHSHHIDHTAHTAAGSGADAGDRCDLGLNTARFNDTAELVSAEHSHAMGEVDFTLEDWAGVFVDEELGMSVDEVIDALGSDDIYRRHVLGGVLTPTLDPDPWSPVSDRSQCEALVGELRTAREVVARYPTVADAVAASYSRGDRYFAGLGVHYLGGGDSDRFDLTRPAMLLFDGAEPSSHLVGLSYVVRHAGDAPPEGFTGANDRWHRHQSFCFDLSDGLVNLSSDVLSPAECAAIGGSFTPNPDLWMLHVWVVPGCENDWGMFAEANPRLPYLPSGTSLASGCNTGRVPADGLDLDARADGPTLT